LWVGVTSGRDKESGADGLRTTVEGGARVQFTGGPSMALELAFVPAAAGRRGADLHEVRRARQIILLPSTITPSPCPPS
jgi:hypothetical protein